MNKQTSPKAPADNFRIGAYWAKVGIFGNVFLTVFKYICGVLGHSAAMIADATHSASDIVASGAVYVSMKISGKPGDKEHPYGHGGADTIATLLVAVMLLIAGASILFGAVEAIVARDFQTPGIIALVAAVVSIVSKEVMFRLTLRAGKKINSPALIADAYHHRSDVYSSIGTVVGIGGAILGLPILDPLAAGIVSFFILHMAYTIFKSAIGQIMRSSCEKEVGETIIATALTVPGVQAVHHVRTQQTGPFITADITIEVDGTLTVEQGHDIAENAVDTLKASMEHLYEVLVHVEPVSMK